MSGALAGREAVERALAALRRAGADQADALLYEGTSVEVRARGDAIEKLEQARERSLGLRALVLADGGLRTATTSTSDLAPDAIDRLAAETVALARHTAADPAAGLPDGGFASEIPDLALADPADASLSLEARIAAARRMEEAARAVDPRVTNSEGSEVSSHHARIAYGNSLGFLGEYRASHHALFSMPIAAEDGAMQTDHWISAGRSWRALEEPASVGRRAAERAVRRLGARRVPTCEVPVIFDPLTARSLLGHLAACATGGSVYRGMSFLAGRLGEAIASPRVTVIDDGRVHGGLGSQPFDGEGLPTRRTPVVEGGRLASWLLDSYSARKLGLASTGNALRGAGGAPAPGTHNFWLEPGDATLDEIVADTPRGLLVTSLFGHGFNSVTGDLSRGAAGHWIEGGKLAFPVHEVTVAGNLGALLLAIDAVGNDLLWQGRTAAPSLRVARLTVAGE
jgi:PmbA protein